MNKITAFSYKFRQNLFLLGGVCLVLYFGYHVVYGARSYSALVGLEQTLSEKQASLDSVSQEREALQERVVMLRANTLSVDMLEERVRSVLGYQNSSDLVVMGN